jgi:dihydrofolate reductase
MPRRKVIVHIAASADGFIARGDGDIEWLTSRPKPDGFYGMGAFMKSVDTALIGRKTYETSVRLGAKFDGKTRNPVFVGDGIPLIARRHRHVLLDLDTAERFEDGVVQLRYKVPRGS